jgi:hypothetical protein
MAWYEKLLLGIVIAADMLGPVLLLLLLRRRTRSWPVAFVGTFVFAPCAAFLVTGGVSWLATYVKVVGGGDTSVPDRIGMSVPDYLWLTFGGCGVYGVLFAGTGFLISLAMLGVWRLVHPASFRRAARIGQDRVRSVAELDYGD